MEEGRVGGLAGELEERRGGEREGPLTPPRFAFHPSPLRLPPFLIEFIAVAVLLALASVGFFWQILFTSTTWMPAGGGDLAPFLYPNYHFAAEQLRQGVIPLWNPHLYSGAPFAADIQSGLFYPVNLLVFLLVPDLTYEWLEYLAVFHFWLAGITMYLCLRLLRPPTADRRPPTSNLQPPTSNLQPPTSNLQPPTSNLQPPTFNPQPPSPLLPPSPERWLLSSAICSLSTSAT